MLFYPSNFWILCLYDSVYCEFYPNLPLKSLSYCPSLAFWTALNLRFSWCYWIYPPKALISLFFFSITEFNLSHYCDKRAILFSLYPFSLLNAFSASLNLFLVSSLSANIVFISFWSFVKEFEERRRFSWANLT